MQGTVLYTNSSLFRVASTNSFTC